MNEMKSGKAPGLEGFPVECLTLSYTAIIGIASFTSVAKNVQCKTNGIKEHSLQWPKMSNARIMVLKNNYLIQLQIK